MTSLLENVAKSEHSRNSHRYRVVLDTSLLISGLFWGKVENRVLKHIFANQEAILSQYIIDELLDFCDDVLPKISRKQKREIQVALENFCYSEGELATTHIRDIADEPIVALALRYDAMIVSSDKDFLEYNQQKPVVLSPKEYQELFMA